MIPVIDCKGDILRSGKDIFGAIQSVGFVYLKNYGIDEEKILSAFEVGKKFWNLNGEVKARFARSKNYEKEDNSGYVAPNVEMLHAKSSSEIREAFNFCSHEKQGARVNEVISGFYETLTELSDLCFEIALKVLRVFAINLNIEDNEFFSKCHHKEKSTTTLRLLHYPPLPDNVEPGTVRCGEHSDYGSITLLFQDHVGGLEVKGCNGNFVPANPVPGTVLINTGDLMQFWTTDRLIAVKHRVLVPEQKELWKNERNSLAYFVHPDDDFIIRPLDGSNTYQPVGAREHLLKMFSLSYGNSSS